MNKLFRTALVSTSTLGLMAVAVPGQALAPAGDAASGGAVAVTATQTVVVPEGTCITHPFNYALTLPDPSKRWQLDLFAYKADGSLRGSATASTYMGSPQPNGTVEMQFCSMSWEPGPVTVQTEFDYRDANDVFYQVTGPTLNLNVVREVKSSASLKVKKKGKNIIALSKVTVSTGATSYAVDGGKVSLQKKVGRKWKTITSKTTSADGKVKFKYNPKGRTAIRTKFAGLSNFTAVGSGVSVPSDVSKVIKVS